MASSVTLQQVLDQVRLRLDMVNNTIISDAELISYINPSLAELHDLLVGVDSEHLLKTQTIPLTGAASYALAADFWQVKKVDFITGGQTFDAQRVSIAEKNRYTNYRTNSRLDDGPVVFYYTADAYLYVLPVGFSGGQLSLLYYPVAPVLAFTSDAWDSLNRFDEYVVCDVCQKVCEKLSVEGSSSWLARKQAVAERVKSMGQDRDKGDSWGMTRLPRGSRG